MYIVRETLLTAATILLVLQNLTRSDVKARLLIFSLQPSGRHCSIFIQRTLFGYGNQYSRGAELQVTGKSYRLKFVDGDVPDTTDETQTLCPDRHY